LVFKLRLSLFEESLNTFLLVIGGHGGDEKGTFVIKSSGFANLEGAFDSAFGESSSDLRFGGNHGRDSESFLEEALLVGKHLAHETPLEGVFCGDKFSSEAHLHRLGLADGVSEAHSATLPGQHAQVDLRQSQLDALGCKQDVGHHGELEATTEGHAVDGSNERLSKLGDDSPLDSLALIVEDMRVKCLVLHLHNVCTRGKTVSSARQNDRRHVLVLLKLLNHLGKLLPEGEVEEDELSGRVHFHEGNSVLDSDFDLGGAKVGVNGLEAVHYHKDII